MSLGNKIVRASNPRGMFYEGIIGTGLTPKPGLVMQLDLSVAEVGGRFTFVLYNLTADGNRGPVFCLREDELQGRIMTTAYAAGERCFLYIPFAGEELNMQITDVGGTADAHTIGTALIVDDGVGSLVDTTGTPESEPFILLETITPTTSDNLARVMYTGY